MLPFVLVTVLFFLWGMSNNLTDILVQQFRKSFELSQFSAQLVQTANFFGYFFMAIPAALLMRRWGYKAGMVTGLVCLDGDGDVLAGGGERAVCAVSDCAVYGGERGFDSGDGGESVYCAVRRSGDFGAAAEFFAVVQSSGDDYRGADRDVLHLLGGGAERGADCGDEGGGYVSGLSAHGDYAGGADVSYVRCGGAAVCVDSVADEVSGDASGA